MPLTSLTPSQYANVRPLYAGLDFNLVIRSVIAGNTPGWVFADNPDAPTAALIWDRQDALLAAGDPRFAADIRALLVNQILPDARSRWIPEMVLLTAPEAWNARIPEMLEGLDPRKITRYYYRFEAPRIAWREQVPEGFSIRRIDDGLLESRLENLDQVRGWIDSFWRSPADFLHAGFGYCALTGDTIAAWCLTVFAAVSARELGLATMPDFRDRGLATLVAAASVEHALADNALPDWHCNADNPPSARVAEKVGFRRAFEYHGYRLSTGLA